MDPHPLLHNSRLTVPERITLAESWIREPDKCPVPDQGPASAMCYLIYRAIEGTLEDETILHESFALPKDSGLYGRWAMSLNTARAYLAMNRAGDDVFREEALCRALKTWATVTRKSWPPQVLNMLRVSVLKAYWDYLRARKQEAIQTIENAFFEWQNHAATYDWHRWPLRTMEARDDLVCLQSLAFIARACGHLKFPDYDWCNPEMLWPIPHTTTCPMYGIARRMSLLLRPDGAGAVWQYRPTQGSLVSQYSTIHATQPYGRGGLSEGLKEQMRAMLGDVEVKQAIDYGCGQSTNGKDLWPEAEATMYDPAIPAHSRFPRRRFDAGICTEVMEHIPLQEVDNTLWEMRCLSPRWVTTIHTAAAAQKLPSGENAHCTQRPTEWWGGRFERIFGTKPSLHPIGPHRFILTIQA